MGYPINPMRPRGNSANQSERVDVLTGQRGKDDTGAAVKRGDAASLGAITLQSGTVTAAPTAAQHNALVADVRALASILNAMGATINGL